MALFGICKVFPRLRACLFRSFKWLFCEWVQHVIFLSWQMHGFNEGICFVGAFKELQCCFLLRGCSDSRQQALGMQKGKIFLIGKRDAFLLMATTTYKDHWGIRRCHTVAILTDLGHLLFNLAAREVLFWSYGCVAELLKTQFPSCPNSSCKRSGRHYRTASLPAQTNTHAHTHKIPIISLSATHWYATLAHTNIGHRATCCVYSK